MNGFGWENLRNLINSFLPWLVSIVSAAGLTVDPFAGTGNMAPATLRTSATGAFKMCKVTIHWTAPTSNPVVIALDANAGVGYDTVLATILMGAVSDLVYYFPADSKFEAGDAVTVAWTNDIGAGTWGVEIAWED